MIGKELVVTPEGLNEIIDTLNPPYMGEEEDPVAVVREILGLAPTGNYLVKLTRYQRKVLSLSVTRELENKEYSSRFGVVRER